MIGLKQLHSTLAIPLANKMLFMACGSFRTNVSYRYSVFHVTEYGVNVYI